MNFSLKQISSLEKVRVDDVLNYDEVKSKTVMAGERFSYQIVLNLDDCPEGARFFANVSVDSPLCDAVKVCRVNQVFVDKPATENVSGEGYLLEEPGFLPDVLVPLSTQNDLISFQHKNVTLWVNVDVPRDCVAGKYDVVGERRRRNGAWKSGREYRFGRRERRRNQCDWR